MEGKIIETAFLLFSIILLIIAMVGSIKEESWGWVIVDAIFLILDIMVVIIDLIVIF